MPRETIVLSGRWRLQLDPQNEGERAGWAGADYDDSRWREVRAPCSLERGHPDLEWYLGAGWYRRRFHAPQSWRGRRVVLRCEGVNYHAAVWLNGQRVAQNEDGFLPFEAPLAAALRYGQENVLALRADNEARAGEAPGQNVGWRPYGGLLREAALCVTPLCHLAWVRVVAEPLPGGAGRLLLQALARNEGPLPRAGALVVRVLGARGQLIGRLSSAPFALAPGQEAILCVEGELAGVRPWRPADPALYTAQAALRLEPAPGLEQADALSTRLGFRRIETRGAALLLNGEPLRLRGFNRHEDTARRGACTDLATARRDLLHMKALGANFVRLCHYPHHPGELELCDELGLLAMGEIPVYGSTGMAEDEALFRAKMERAARQLAAMVRRDGNHPALIFWSVSNETHEQHPVVVQANDTLIRQAHALDPTRLVVHVSDHWQPRRDGSGGCTAFDLDDVLCLNAYPWMGDPELARPARLAEQTAWWRENLARLHALFPHKPILITEFGYVSYEGTYGYLLGEDTHAANLEAAYAGMDAPYVCGATIWCYADHAWPHKLQPPWIGAPAENPISPYGVVTRARKPKALACAAVERMFGARP